jgi:tRNA G18 (ribose-2'-O)-methylase SpoU
VALTPDVGAVPVDQLAFDGVGDRDAGYIALLFRAEGQGAVGRDPRRSRCSRRIPMRGGVDSLNVGVAAGIALWVLGCAGPRRVWHT